MLIYPAIDLMGGKAVRLTRGEANSQEVVGDPLELVDRFRAAPLMHVIDLDGAFAGRIIQMPLIQQLASRHPIQVGGGIRTLEDVDKVFEAGASRAVLGTAAVTNSALLSAALIKWGSERIVVAVDVKEGRVAVAGWTQTSLATPDEFSRRLADLGVRWVLCTAVHRDGTMEGPDISLLERVQNADSRLRLIASGGIGSLADIVACKRMAAVIVGKGLYAGRFTLAEAMAC